MVIMSTSRKKIFYLSLDGISPLYPFYPKALSLSTFCIDFRER